MTVRWNGDKRSGGVLIAQRQIHKSVTEDRLVNLCMRALHGHDHMGICMNCGHAESMAGIYVCTNCDKPSVMDVTLALKLECFNTTKESV